MSELPALLLPSEGGLPPCSLSRVRLLGGAAPQRARTGGCRQRPARRHVRPFFPRRLRLGRACGGMPALLLPLAVETENVEIARTLLVFRLLQFQPYLPPYSLRPMPKAVYSRPKEGNQFCFGVAKNKLPLHLSYVGGREERWSAGQRKSTKPS